MFSEPPLQNPAYTTALSAGSSVHTALKGKNCLAHCEEKKLQHAFYPASVTGEGGGTVTDSESESDHSASSDEASGDDEGGIHQHRLGEEAKFVCTSAEKFYSKFVCANGE